MGEASRNPKREFAVKRFRFKQINLSAFPKNNGRIAINLTSTTNFPLIEKTFTSCEVRAKFCFALILTIYRYLVLNF